MFSWPPAASQKHAGDTDHARPGMVLPPTEKYLVVVVVVVSEARENQWGTVHICTLRRWVLWTHHAAVRCQTIPFGIHMSRRPHVSGVSCMTRQGVSQPVDHTAVRWLRGSRIKPQDSISEHQHTYIASPARLLTAVSRMYLGSLTPYLLSRCAMV